MSRRFFTTMIIVSAPVLAAHAQSCDWEPLGTGVAPAADACAVLANGHVVAGGRMTLAGSIGVNHIARWDGSAWNSMGNGLNSFVRTLLALPDGSVLAGGQFDFPSGGPNGLIARWNGSAWESLGLGLDAGSCRALARTETGEIIAGGSFLQADELPAWGVARWNGDNWTKLGSNTDGGGVSGWLTPEPSPTMVQSVVVMPNGDIIVGGNFSRADGLPATGIARWDGDGWQPLGQGVNAPVRAMTLLDDGDLLVAGLFGVAGGIPVRGLARWDGTEWSAFGEGFNGINQRSPFSLLTLPDGRVVMGGAFDMVDSVSVNNLAVWDPNSDEWSAMGSGAVLAIQTTVLDLASDPRGVVYASGQFASAGGSVDARNIAMYDCLADECVADLGSPFGVLDLGDVQTFVAGFTTRNAISDLDSNGVFDLVDIQAFVAAFIAGCP